MKLCELFEDVITGPEINQLDEFFELVRRDCQPYIQGMNDTLLYRGIIRTISGGPKLSDNDNLLTDVPIHQDRKSIYTPNDANEALSYYMRQDGFVATRTNSLFTFPDPTLASHFGKTYIIFPIGPVNFTWHDPEYDLPNDVGASEWVRLSNQHYCGRNQDRIPTDQQTAEYFWKEYGRFYHCGNSLGKDIQSEILVQAKSFHAMSRFYLDTSDKKVRDYLK
jgi:hypothetical protein